MGGTQTKGVGEQGAKENIWTKEGQWKEGGENCIMRSFITCTVYQV
jgi:hypothetical protein